MAVVEKFDVFQFFEDGSYEKVRDSVTAEEAAKAAGHYCTSVAVQMRVVVRVIITDAFDLTCFEWKLGEGIVFPPQEGK